MSAIKEDSAFGPGMMFGIPGPGPKKDTKGIPSDPKKEKGISIKKKKEMKHVLTFEEFVNEAATVSWKSMMDGVRSGDSGPWSIVAIYYNKVIDQEINIKIRDLIPAAYEEMKRKNPRANIHIEDRGGSVVWSDKSKNK